VPKWPIAPIRRLQNETHWPGPWPPVPVVEHGPCPLVWDFVVVVAAALVLVVVVVASPVVPVVPVVVVVVDDEEGQPPAHRSYCHPSVIT
jgi:hypothetical protein